MTTLQLEIQTQQPTQPADTIQDHLDRDNVDGALAVMSKMRFTDLKDISARFGIGFCFISKKHYLERAQLVLPRLTKSARVQGAHAAQLVALADRYERARHFRELNAGALAMGGYDASRRNERGVAEYEAEMAAIAAEFARESRLTGVPDAIKDRCALVMDAIR